MTTCPSCNEWVSDHHLCPVTPRKPPGGTPDRPPDHEHDRDAVGGGCLTCYTRGAASRSEQATCTNDSPPSWTEHWREWHRGHGCEKDPSAAEAAQSPQEGAAHETLEQWAQNIANVTGIAAEARESVRLLALQLLHGSAAGHYCGAKWKPWPQLVCSAKHAEPGRSVSDRPPASESPGPLAALLREARVFIGNIDLVARIDAALRESSAERGGEER